MLPLFAEEASSGIYAAALHVNPGQIPVICVDQPLPEKLEKVQWFMHSQYGEDTFVILLGGLHKEMTWHCGIF